MAETTLEIPAKSVYVGVVRLALASLARVAGLDEDRIEDLRMAVSEACANAVVADESTENRVTINWKATDDRIVVEVIDKATREGVSEPATGTGRLEMSVALLRSLVDECTFETHPDGGLTTTLTLLI